MEKALLTLFALSLLAYSLQAGAQPDNPAAAELVADAGGPYQGAAGSVVHLDSSGSSGNITAYYWDYGDGSTGTGKAPEHAYAKEGSYQVMLKVTDQSGRISYSPTGAFIKPVAIYMGLAAEPLKDIYDYGDTLTRIDARVYYSNGSPVRGASVTGTLDCLGNVALKFAESGNGDYYSDQSCPIVKGMEKFINLTVDAKDLGGKTADMKKKIPIRPVSSDDPNDRASVFLTINSPAGNTYANGQAIAYKVSFERVSLNDRSGMDAGDVLLQEDWNDKAYKMTKSGSDYVLDYQMPSDAGSRMHYIIYGTGTKDGKTYNAVTVESFDISNRLVITVVSPENDSYGPDVKQITLKAAYPDGENVPDQQLRALIGKDLVVFARSEGFFTADYRAPANQSRLDIWAYDEKGNGGGAKIRLTNTKPQAANDNGPLSTQLMYALLPIAGLLVAGFLGYRFVEGRRSSRSNLKKEYDETVQKIESLKAVTNNVMNEYYTRKITEEEARSRVLDCEKELVMERRKLKDVMQKLGMKPDDNPEKAVAAAVEAENKEEKKEE